MTLSENGFAILGVSPSDDRRTLTMKADEAALLGGEDAEAAFHQLLQMNRRIQEELSWFPGSSREAADAFLEYSRQIEKGLSPALPPMTGLGTVLAQANALSSFFSIWPVDDPDFFIGLCCALDGILSKVNAEDTLQAINADRTAGNWEIIHDIKEIEEPLDTHLRNLCEPVASSAGKKETKDLSSTLTSLFQKKEFDTQGNVAQALASVYSVRIHEKAEPLKSKIGDEINRISQKTGVYISSSLDKEIPELQKLVESWCELTGPLREIPGTIRNDDRKIGQGMRNFVVDYVNKAPQVQKQKIFTIHRVVGNNRRVTITYRSKKDTVTKALKIVNWIKQHFSTHLDLTEQLNQDLDQLQQMIRDEDEMIKKAEQEERDKYPLSF